MTRRYYLMMCETQSSHDKISPAKKNDGDK